MIQVCECVSEQLGLSMGFNGIQRPISMEFQRDTQGYNQRKDRMECHVLGSI